MIAGNREALEACQEILGNAFDVAGFVSQATYFVGTPLMTFLSQRVAGQLENAGEAFERLGRRLEEIEVSE